MAINLGLGGLATLSYRPSPEHHYRGENMAKTIELTCKECGKVFDKLKKEHDRQVREGREPDHFFCSQSCVAKWANREYPEKHPGDASRIEDYQYESDEHSPFRYFLKNIRASDKEYNIDLPYLKELWEKQEGKGVYTNWELKNPSTMSARENSKLKPETARLDRIDSNKGYIKGNVQFVSYMANMAKNKFSGEQLRDFCEAVTDNN